MFHVVADTKWGRNKLVDILALEHHHEIILYDTDLVIRNGYAPLDMGGMLVNPTGTFPYLVNHFPFNKVWFREITLASVESLNPRLHEAKVRATMELILGKI